MVLSLSSAPNLHHHHPNGGDSRYLRLLSLRNPHHLRFSKRLNLRIKAFSAPVQCNLKPPARVLKPGDIFRQLAASTVLLLSLGFTLHSFSASARAAVAPPLASSESQTQDSKPQENDEGGQAKNVVEFDDEELQAQFEKWKAKTYALTVPLRIVSFNNSFPPVWIKDFIRSQGKRAQVRPEFRRSLQDIFRELSTAFEKGVLNPKSAAAADVIALGDAWLSFAIKNGLIEPMQGVEDQDWFNGLSDRWKVYLRRSCEGKLDSQGRIWSAPFRWGSIVIAYKKREFRKRNLAPIKDWDDLWRPEIAGRISMVDSPREIVGAVLKYMGASYNTKDFESEVTGGRNAVQQNLASLVKQVRLFDSQNYLKAFGVEDVWVAVGWSTDILPAAKRMSNIAVIVPKSGASLWADFWAIPAATRIASHQVGGRVRGPSPLLHQWIEFCLQAERESPFKDEVIPGATPYALKAPIEVSEDRKRGKPKLETNLIAGVPPPDILTKCEFLEPLSDKALSDYQWLISSIQKPNPSLTKRLQQYILSVLQTFSPKVQSKVV